MLTDWLKSRFNHIDFIVSLFIRKITKTLLWSVWTSRIKSVRKLHCAPEITERNLHFSHQKWRWQEICALLVMARVVLCCCFGWQKCAKETGKDLEMQLMRALVWADAMCWIRAFEMWAWRRKFRMSCRAHRANVWVREKVGVSEEEDCLQEKTEESKLRKKGWQQRRVSDCGQCLITSDPGELFGHVSSFIHLTLVGARFSIHLPFALQSIKQLRQSDLMPFIVFVAPPTGINAMRSLRRQLSSGSGPSVSFAIFVSYLTRSISQLSANEMRRDHDLDIDDLYRFFLCSLCACE